MVNIIKNGICAFLFILTLSSCTDVDKLYTVQPGVYDISNIDTDKVYSMKGRWAYAEKELMPPNLPIELYTRFEAIDAAWTTYEQAQSVYGYASYAIRITGFSPEKVYAMYFPRTSSACAAFLNGKQFYASGTPGKTFEEEIFDWNTEIALLPISDDQSAELVIYVSNFHDRNPGIEMPFYIGLYTAIQAKKSIDKLITSSIFSLLLAMATFFISLFLFYRKETPACLFGLLCFSFAIRTLCYNDLLLKDFFPALSSLIMFRLGYLTFPACGAFTFLFIFDLFIKNKMKWAYICIVPLVIYAVMTIVCPMYVFINLLVAVQFYVIFLALVVCGIVLYAFKCKKTFSLLFLISFLLFFAAMVFDVLISNGIITAPFISHFAVMFMLVSMAFIIIRHFVSAFETQKSLIETIAETNMSFQRFFPNEFMQFLNKKNVIDIALGDNTYKNMFVAFIHLGIKADLITDTDREELLALYNTVVQAANPIIRQHKGFIDKYLAEGLMVLFYGTAEETLNCVIDITHLIEKLNIHRKKVSLSPIHISSGIHYGKLMMGTIGEAERMDTTVISDVVNIASRMHSYATKKDVHVMMSEPVRTQLPESYWRTHTCFYHGKIQFHGKQRLTNVYEVSAL